MTHAGEGVHSDGAQNGASRWGPSFWGRALTGTAPWTLQVNPQKQTATLRTGQRVVTVPADAVTVTKGRIWSTVALNTPDGPRKLSGLPNAEGKSLQLVLDHCRHVAVLRGVFDQGVTQLTAWSQSLEAELTVWADRWWPRELTERWTTNRPRLDSRFRTARQTAELQTHLQNQPATVQRALAWWDTNLSKHIADRNQQFLAQEAVRRRDFFATVESSPLTPEQVEAVVCLDNRVQVVAAAGSGKTSTMVARAAYVVQHDLIPADKILMLAFNKKAAEELKERVRQRVGDRGVQVTASTFHAFGLGVVGKATGRKPRVPRGLGDGDGEGVTRLEEVVDALRDRDLGFRLQWDLFRLVFGRPLTEPDEDEAPTDAAAAPGAADVEDWDTDGGPVGYRTLNGELVKSREELMLANWLFYNGVRYDYERDYEHDTVDAEHSQYRPDFYYPDIDVYHEHFALNSKGEPPPQFVDYLQGVHWKRAAHAQYGTTLVETTSATVRNGTAFDYLAQELTDRGITLDPNPDRDVPGEQPLRSDQLFTILRTFLTHVKSNQLTAQQLRDRVAALPGDRLRAARFLELFLPVLREWDERLRQAEEIDFEDMINRAADLIETGAWVSPYQLVMVDEMQDSSHARSRLIHALVSVPDRYLFAVGDDWQSINRFAGSDLSVMTRFTEWFGPGHTLKLERTFRSPQSICDISSGFVTRNPEQITKQVRSTQPEHLPAVRAVAVGSDDQYADVILRHLQRLEDNAAKGEGPAGRQLEVLILGRYKAGRTKVQAALAQPWKHLQVKYSTVHSAKGKEADYVIVTDLTRRGFPSTIEDDPLLTLAMPAAEQFPHAEERRLFYVALTRTRRSVLLLTLTNRESPFLLELLARKQATLTSATGEPIDTTPCPTCKRGRMTVRINGKTGEKFMGCNRYPECRHTHNLVPSKATKASSRPQQPQRSTRLRPPEVKP